MPGRAALNQSKFNRNKKFYKNLKQKKYNSIHIHKIPKYLRNYLSKMGGKKTKKNRATMMIMCVVNHNSHTQNFFQAIEFGLNLKRLLMNFQINLNESLNHVNGPLNKYLFSFNLKKTS